MATCSASNRTFAFLQDPIVYQDTDVIRRVHSGTPRWGQTDDIDALYLGTKEEGKDYMIGLLASTIAIALFLFVWGMLLIGCKCAGPRYAGIFSGSLKKSKTKPVKAATAGGVEDHSLQLQQEDYGDSLHNRKPEEPFPVEHDVTDGAGDSSEYKPEEQFNDEPGVQEEDDPSAENAHYLVALSEWHAARVRQERRLKRARIVVLLCSFGIVICVILMLTKGIQSLVDASNDAVDGIAKAESLSNQAIVLIDDFIARQDAASNATRSFIASVNGFCPEIRQALCTDLNDQNATATCNFTGIPYADELKAFVASSRDVIFEKVNSTRDDLVEFADTMGRVHDKSDNFKWAFVVASVFAILLLVLNLFISYGVISAWRKQTKANCVQKVVNGLRHWMMVPIFVFLVFISCIFCMVFIIGSIATADTCVDDPDARLEALLEKEGNFLDSPAYFFLLFYIKGCPIDELPDDFLEQFDRVVGVLDNVSAFASKLLNATVDRFQEVCGADTEPALLITAATVLERTICNVVETLGDVQAFFSCENWRPLYRVVVYDAVCYNATDGLNYIAITQFCIVIFAFIMLTLRVAFAEISDEDLLGLVDDGAPAKVAEEDLLGLDGLDTAKVAEEDHGGVDEVAVSDVAEEYHEHLLEEVTEPDQSLA